MTIILCAVILVKPGSTIYSFAFLKALASRNNILKENAEKDHFQLLNSKICLGNQIFCILSISRKDVWQKNCYKMRDSN